MTITPVRHRVGTVPPMAPPAKIRVDGRVHTHPARGAGFTPLPGLERMVPSKFDAWADLLEPRCSVHLVVTIDDRRTPVVQVLTVAQLDGPPAGPPVTASVVRRIALESLLRLAVEDASQPMTVRDDVETAGIAFDVPGAPEGTVIVTPRPRPLTGRGRRTSDEVLRRVAKVYREATGGRAPTQAVADELGVSRSHAGRLVGQARNAGYLGATKPGKAGEADA